MIRFGLSGRNHLPLTVLRLAVAAAGLALAAVWLTRLLAPGPVAVLASVPVQASAVNAADALKVFGAGGADSQAAGFELTGLYAGGPGRGFATFRTPRGAKSAQAGEEIDTGVRLQKVASDHVILSVDGAERRLEIAVQPPADNLGLTHHENGHDPARTRRPPSPETSDR